MQNRLAINLLALISCGCVCRSTARRKNVVHTVNAQVDVSSQQMRRQDQESETNRTDEELLSQHIPWEKLPELRQNLKALNMEMAMTGKEAAKVNYNQDHVPPTVRNPPQTKKAKIKDIIFYHPIEFATAIAKTVERQKAVEGWANKNRPELLPRGNKSVSPQPEDVGENFLNMTNDFEKVPIMQSTDAIQAVALYRVPKTWTVKTCSEGPCKEAWEKVEPKYLVTSGQGRMTAVKDALGEETEVELQVFTLPRSIVFRMAAIHNCFIKQARMNENQWLEDVPNLVGCAHCGLVLGGDAGASEEECGKLPDDYDGGSWCTNSMPMDSPHRSWRKLQTQSGGISLGFRFQVLQCPTFMQYVIHKYFKYGSRQLKCCKHNQAHCLALSGTCPPDTKPVESDSSCDVLAGRTRWQGYKQCEGGIVLENFRNDSEKTRYQKCDQLCREKVPDHAQVCCMYDFDRKKCEAAPLGHGQGQAQYKDSSYGMISPLRSPKMAAVIDTRVSNMLDLHEDEGFKGVKKESLCEGTTVESILSLVGPQPVQ